MKIHLLDTLPRPWLGQLSRRVPTFRSCGIAGFYLAVIATFAAGLLAGGSLLTLAACSVVCAASFFTYAYARKAIAGKEQLVLFEMVWFAEISSALFLFLIGEPLPTNLDAIAVGMCFFLAGGRVGCFMAGCCHGKPSSFGVVYGERHEGSGFERALLGVRLFPLQLIEAIGLIAIGSSGLVVIHFTEPGTVFVWFLAAYAVMRFGLEGLRGDLRPTLFGLSQSRWMALAELGAAIAWYERARFGATTSAIMAALLGGALFAASIRWMFAARRRLLAPAHLVELRESVRRALGEERLGVATTSRGLSFAASLLEDGRAHVSLSMPGAADELETLTEAAGGAFPELDPVEGQYRPSCVLHFDVAPELPGANQRKKTRAGRELYGTCVRAMQAEVEPVPPQEAPIELRRAQYFERGA